MYILTAFYTYTHYVHRQWTFLHTILLGVYNLHTLCLRIKCECFMFYESFKSSIYNYFLGMKFKIFIEMIFFSNFFFLRVRWKNCITFFYIAVRICRYFNLNLSAGPLDNHSVSAQCLTRTLQLHFNWFAPYIFIFHYEYLCPFEMFLLL